MEPDSIRAEFDSLITNDELLAARVTHLEKCLNTLQTPLWKRLWFRIDGWPGQRNLNADHRAWRPWHRDR
jgi:uncharacterized membrane protein